MSLPAPHLGLAAIPLGARRLVVVGDTQRASRLELGRPKNDHLRERLFEVIAAERPDAVILVGDLVAWGPVPRHWRLFDRATAPLRDARIPTVAVLGNHDSYFWRPLGLRQAARRFPDLAIAPWWRFRAGPLLLVGLDSNFGPLGPSARAAQARFVADTVAEADADPAIEAVLGFWHHPPMTNSWLVGPNREVQASFVRPLRATPKLLATFSGHCHAFEHFRRGPHHHFTTGGGGGPAHRMRLGRFRRAECHYPTPGDYGFMHHTVLDRAGDSLRVEVRRLDASGRTSADYATELPLPARRA